MTEQAVFLKSERTITQQMFPLTSFLNKRNAAIWGPDGSVYTVNLPCLRRMVKVTSHDTQLNLSPESIFLTTENKDMSKVEKITTTVKTLKGKRYFCVEWHLLS